MYVPEGPGGVCEHICIASLFACRSHLLSKPRADERSFAFLAPARVPPALGPGTPPLVSPCDVYVYGYVYVSRAPPERKPL